MRAFLQPLREAGREQARPSPLGLRREDRYLMLGEPDVPAAPGDRVVWRESGYEVRTAHPIYLGERAVPLVGSAGPLGQGGDMSGRTGTDPGGADRPPQWEGYPGSTCLERDGADVPLRAGGRSIPAGVHWGPAGLSRLSGGAI